MAKFDIKNPKATAKTGLICAAVSFFIFGQGLSIGACVLGTFGTYYAVKNKSGRKWIFLNILCIILGFISNVFLNWSKATVVQ